MNLVLKLKPGEVPPPPQKPTIISEVTATKAFSIDEESSCILHLKDLNLSPVKWDDLEIAHTKRIHLLIIDDSLTDYHHIHPEPGLKPGEFSFKFKPKAGGKYQVWADLLPKGTGLQEYSKTEINVTGTPRPLAETFNDSTSVDGYQFKYTLENRSDFKVNEPVILNVRVTKPNGDLANDLEPVMGTYAHGVGFTASHDSVIHVHPMGVEPKTDEERGAGDLKFILVPPKPGWLKFYVQVQLGGVSKFAGFGLQVKP